MNEKKPKETINPDDFFPKIKSAKDNYGNSLENPVYAQTIQSKTVLREGDVIELNCEIKNHSEEIEYRIARIGEQYWSPENNRSIKLERKDIGKTCDIQVMIRSKKDYHAYGDFDDYVEFRYIVVPK
jgi:hypothetical protein